MSVLPPTTKIICAVGDREVPIICLYCESKAGGLFPQARSLANVVLAGQQASENDNCQNVLARLNAHDASWLAGFARVEYALRLCAVIKNATLDVVGCGGNLENRRRAAHLALAVVAQARGLVSVTSDARLGTFVDLVTIVQNLLGLNVHNHSLVLQESLLTNSVTTACPPSPSKHIRSEQVLPVHSSENDEVRMIFDPLNLFSQREGGTLATHYESSPARRKHDKIPISLSQKPEESATFQTLTESEELIAFKEHIWALADACRWEDIDSIIDAEINKLSFYMNENLLRISSILSLLAKHRKPDVATQCLQRIHAAGIKPDEKSYACVINAWAQLGDIGNAERCWQDMICASIEPSEICCSCMANAYANAGDVRRSEEWFENRVAVGWEARVEDYNIILKACAKNGDIARAERWMRNVSMACLQPTEVTYASILSTCACNGDIEKAEHWFHEMVHSGFSPTLHSYNTLLRACATKGCLEKAESWMQCMENQSFIPDEYSYRYLIEACVKNGCKNHDKALYWFRNMGYKKIQPDLQVLTMMIRACSRIDEAETWLKKILDAGLYPDLSTYTALIFVCAQVGHREAAVKWFEKAVQDSLQPTLLTYATLINAYAVVGDVNGAELWVNRMHDAGIESNLVIYNTMIKACRESRDSIRAEYWFKQISFAGLSANIMTFTCMIQVYSRKGDVKRAELLMNENPSPNRTNYLQLMKLCAQAGLTNKVEAWFLAMINIGIAPTRISYDIIINAYAQQSHCEKAEEWIMQMSADGVQPDLLIYSCIVNAYESVGNAKKVEEWCAKMNANGIMKIPSIQANQKVDIVDRCAQSAVLGDPQLGEKVRARVACLRNTHQRIQPRFTCNRALVDVVDDLLAGRTSPTDFPTITVVKFKGKWYSANNRRLWCLKQVGVDTIEAVVGEPNAHFLRGLNTETDGWEVGFFPPVVCPTCRCEFVNRTALSEHRCAYDMNDDELMEVE